VASNPEFLREGSAVEDSLRPQRILVGSDSAEALATLREVYAPAVRDGARWIETDLRTAELAKHACNAFLALKISYVNSLARICELAGADVVSVAEVMGSDPRIGPAFLAAGLGYGGSCFPKDLQAFHALSSKLGYDFPLLPEIARINEEALGSIVDKIRDGLWNLENKTIALLGLAFKPGTDDVRFAPALALARRLMDEGSRVVGYDPQAMANAKDELPELEAAADPLAAATGAHCLVVCTEWPEFRQLDLGMLKDVMVHPLVVDGRNLFQAEDMRTHGFTYYPTGQPSVG
jgi:UDPglucose 6-dehydrogenase